MENKLSVLIIEPEKPARQALIDDGLNSLQAIVGGSIEATYPFDDPVAIICNEEGKLLHLPPCRALYDESGELYDIVAGTFLVVGLGYEDFASLSPELTEKYLARFQRPELFWPANNNKIMIFQL